MFCQHQIPSVGGSIGIERLFTILEARYKEKVKENACEIFVATVGKVEVKDKLSVLGDLWQSNIKAEVNYTLFRPYISKRQNLTSKSIMPLKIRFQLYYGLERSN